MFGGHADIPADYDAPRALTLALYAELKAKSLYIGRLKMRIAVLERIGFGGACAPQDELPVV